MRETSFQYPGVFQSDFLVQRLENFEEGEVENSLGRHDVGKQEQ